MTWWKKLKGRVRLKEPLRNKTTFKIGGPAKFFIEPKDAADLQSLIISAKKYNIPILLIGRGSNILISDKGVDAAVLQLNSPPFKRVINRGSLLEVGSGLTLAQLIQSAKSYSLSGIEFLAGIPGTVGGALTMNAGAWGNNLGDIVENVTVMDYNGKVKILNKKDIGFGYRKSNLARFIILSTRIRLIKKNKKEINSNIKKYLRFRRNAQDNYLPNAGCIFKNPSGRQAGRLIDLCGLKGRRQGGAFVSLRHANFILNRGDACAADVLKLMNLIKNRVKHKFNVNLKPEIKIWK